MVEKIIDPVDPALIEQELTPERFLRRTNKADNVIYVVDAKCAPHTMREIGRLREISFRASGGGTGKACDIDEFDLMAPPCRQLLVWNPHKREIIGAYRFIAGNDIKTNADGSPRIAMGHMFKFSPAFMRDYLPVTIELGRSFVRPEYQSTHAGVKAIFALDNLWDGLGALTVVHPEMKYLMGKMTMYPAYRHDCRNLLLAFLNLYFPDPDVLVRPIDPLETNADEQELESFFAGNDFKEDYRRLNAYIRDHGINIPPLVNAYMSLSPKMRMFGTAINHEFGEVEESGIFFKIDEIANQKKSRHIDTYIKDSM
ncbi:MAG: GNAT family N-acetyltransferase [Sodaliphilus pleomorphus]|uniref:GNAT family N-acetyltransferase n=1 Tax=Sodaliphilus pleomorphus TaxID=2606626 RepID=UPI0023EF6B77|nr:GNAT family N-acetyltransferase [Sodaliphilus pleomorphus]MCI5980630.1 GNAT family N-acetyltransferase [Muribaculaceae bacterium]MDD7065463.1 GNAT family N-acetyltransferase [Sodaliphilus pleomorphus]MDY2832081.1 GNAT family N-acetyltransferase [Sodaliphilus pleomorphus]MDY6258269.1 GNAT family N-acetyltransferase [Bacteroidales bacterium]